MISVAELIRDPDLAQSFQVERVGGAFANEGEWTPSAPTILNMVGVIQPATRDDIVSFLPEGIRHSETIIVYCDTKIQMDDANAQRSDVIIWRGHPYRVVVSRPWVDYGYWKVGAEGFQR